MHVITKSKMVLYDEPKACNNEDLLNNKDDVEHTEITSISDANDEDNDNFGEKMGETKLSRPNQLDIPAKKHNKKKLLLTTIFNKR